MNKRDYFAAQAMQGIIAKMPMLLAETNEESFDAIYLAVANGAYKYADAMLILRELTKEEE